VIVGRETVASALVLYCDLQYVEKAAVALALAAPYRWTPTRRWEILRDGNVVRQGYVEIPRNGGNMNWQTKDGRSIPVSEMETEHIQSALAMLKQRGFVSPKTPSFYVACSLPQGEMAQDAFDRELDAVFDAPCSKFIDLFQEELEKRGIAP